MVINLLLRLIIAHLLTDFLLQPTAWIEDRKAKKIKSVKLIWHVCLTTIVAYIFSGLYSCWWLPLAIFISHYVIDLVKAYLPDTFLYFIGDQVLHLLTIVIIWLIIDKQWPVINAALFEAGQHTNVWLVTLGYVTVTWPLGIIIGKATAAWRDDIEATQKGKEGLANAGKWIGICERALILTFVLTGQYTAIGFLMTAKSILRFGDKEKNAQKKTEYVLVGTLLSFAASALIGVALAYLLKK